MMGQYRFLPLVLFIVSLFAASLATAQVNAKRPTAEEMLNVNGAQGKEFLFAIPYNDGSQGQADPEVEFYIASSYDNVKVTVTFNETGESRSYRTGKAYSMLTLSSNRNQVNNAWEVTQEESEIVISKSVSVLADKPISLYVVYARNVSSDGFLALPVSVFSNKYIVTSYFDFKEFGGNAWAGGYIVIAKEDDTELNIQIRGTTDGYGKTMRGRMPGDQVTVTLQRGQTYAMIGDGTTRGVFDLTGTEINSNKPIGLMSFHSRSSMPNCVPNGNGRDHLVEMTPPVQAWGKRYVTINYSRSQTGASGGSGDVFRVIASQDNTKWTLKYYDRVTQQLIGQDGGLLQKAGDFRSIEACSPTALPTGITVWEADKPIFVMQYSTSANWDGDIQNDPFMINVTPTEQFLKETVFQSPMLDNYTKHLLNLIVKAPTTDDLKTLTVDGRTVYNHPRAQAPQLLLAKIPGFTDLYYATIDFDSEAKGHRITGNGNVTFGGYIYGFGNFDSYGWPAAAQFKNTAIIDTLEPQLKRDSLCGDFDFTTTEVRNIPDPPRNPPGELDQVETGVAEIDFMQDDTLRGWITKNYQMIQVSHPGGFPRDPLVTSAQFRLEVIDKSQDAAAWFYIKDYADNIKIDSCFYFADKVTFTPNPLDFQKNLVGTTKDIVVTVRNSSSAEVELKTTRLKSTNQLKGTYFEIVAGGAPPVVKIPGNGSVQLTVRYFATRETTDPNSDWDIDTLIIETSCSEFKLGMRGMAIMPRIRVEDWDAGCIGVGEQRCKQNGLRISNPGTADLIITGFQNVGSNFTISTPTVPPLPITVPARDSVQVSTICYQRGTIGTDQIDVVINSNATGAQDDDSVSNWKGCAQAPGPNITSYDWQQRRVNTLNQGLVHVYNTGTSTLSLTAVEFTTGGIYWPAGSNEGNYVFKISTIQLNGTPGTPVTLVGDGTVANDSADVVVLFRPGAEQTYRADIIPIFADATTTTPGYLAGEGILPKIQTVGAALNCQETPENQGVVRPITISNNNGTMPLTISRLAFAAGTSAAFQWVTAPPTPITIAPNTSQNFDVRYTRPNGFAGGDNLTVEIEHDAVPGNGTDTTVTPVQATETITVGGCTGPDISVTDIDFGNQLANCDTPESEFTITNTGGGPKKLQIDTIYAVDPDGPAFTIVAMYRPNGTTATFPLLIDGAETYRIVVRFTPTEPSAAPWANRTYQTRFAVINRTEGDPNELRPNTYSTVRGVGYVAPVSFSLTNDQSSSELQPGEEIAFTVSAEAGSWAPAAITSFVADVLFDSDAHVYTANSVTPSAALAGWTITEPTVTVIDATRSRMSFTATGGAAVPGTGALFTFRTTLLLAGGITTTQDLEISGLRACTPVTTTGDSTTIQNCALTLRPVTITGTLFRMDNPTPNPATSGTVAVEIGIGFAATTRIDLIDVNGAVVKTLYAGRLAEGNYGIEFPTAGIGNGVYFVRMHSAQFTQIRQVVIAD